MAFIIDTSVSFPEHFYQQEQISNYVKNLFSLDQESYQKLKAFHEHALVKGRHLALPLEAYTEMEGLGGKNDAWIETALDLGESALNSLLEKNSLPAEDVNLIVSTTTTGISSPTIDARLMNRIPFSQNLKRMPLFALGCLGGAAGVARAADYLDGHPKDSAVLLSVELCSLTLQKDDLSIANLVSSGLFGDGAAAVLLVGDEHPLAQNDHTPKVIAKQSIMFPNSERVMGWDITDTGFKVVLSPEVPDYAQEALRPYVEKFLKQRDLTIKDIRHWIAHPGGPKVIEALVAGLDLPEDAFALSLQSLKEVGNMSSASVLMILGETMDHFQPDPGTYGVLMALGPGFCAELVLLQW